MKKSGVWGTYEYFMTDHLGNTAISFDRGTNGSAEIIQGNTYYAFGLGLVDGTMAYQKGDKNRRLFNKGSELQDDFGLNVYFTRDRTLALDAPRWWQIDPKADQGSLVNCTLYCCVLDGYSFVSTRINSNNTYTVKTTYFQEF